MFICLLYIFFGELSIKIFGPFLKIGLFSYHCILRVVSKFLDNSLVLQFIFSFP